MSFPLYSRFYNLIDESVKLCKEEFVIDQKTLDNFFEISEILREKNCAN